MITWVSITCLLVVSHYVHFKITLGIKYDVFTQKKREALYFMLQGFMIQMDISLTKMGKMNLEGTMMRRATIILDLAMPRTLKEKWEQEILTMKMKMSQSDNLRWGMLKRMKTMIGSMIDFTESS